MQNTLDGIALFVEVANRKSFTKASAALGMPVSTLSRRIAKLEQELHTRLINRNSRKVELSEAGRIFFQHCEFILAEAVAAREALTHTTKNPSGRIRIAAPADLTYFCSSVFVEFATLYPEIQLDIQHQEMWGDLIADPIDLEVRVGDLPESNLVARRIATLQPALYASPALLEKYSLPQTPHDILTMPCLCLRQALTWPLVKGNRKEELTPRPRAAVSSIFFLIDMAIAGLGVAMLSKLLAKEHVEQGTLIELLPDWHIPAKPVYVVMAGHNSPARVSIFVDFMAEKLSNLRQQFPGL